MDLQVPSQMGCDSSILPCLKYCLNISLSLFVKANIKCKQKMLLASKIDICVMKSCDFILFANIYFPLLFSLLKN